MKNLSPDEYYQNIYTQVLNGGSIGAVSKIIHRKLESKAVGSVDTILELGSGSGQHFGFVTQNFKRYLETDIRLSNIPSRPQPCDRTIERRKIDAEDLHDLATDSVDRLVSSCLLIHLANPEKALMEWRRVVKKRGGRLVFMFLVSPVYS